MPRLPPLAEGRIGAVLGKPVAAFFTGQGALSTAKGIQDKNPEEILTGAAATALPALGLFAKSPLEQPIKPKEQNASQISKTAEVHGDMQSFAGESEGKMPAKESGGGVQPQAEKSEVALKPSAAEILKMSPQAISDLRPEQFTAHVNSKPGGLTGEAWRVGLAAKTPEVVSELKKQMEASSSKLQAAKQAKDYDTAFSLGAKGQFFREAYEAATGTGSAGFALREKDPNYKPPFPIEEKSESEKPPGMTSDLIRHYDYSPEDLKNIRS